jgi:hypothetical protein
MPGDQGGAGSVGTAAGRATACWRRLQGPAARTPSEPAGRSAAAGRQASRHPRPPCRCASGGRWTGTGSLAWAAPRRRRRPGTQWACPWPAPRPPPARRPCRPGGRGAAPAAPRTPVRGTPRRAARSGPPPRAMWSRRTPASRGVGAGVQQELSWLEKAGGLQRAEQQPATEAQGPGRPPPAGLWRPPQLPLLLPPPFSHTPHPQTPTCTTTLSRGQTMLHT